MVNEEMMDVFALELGDTQQSRQPQQQQQQQQQQEDPCWRITHGELSVQEAADPEVARLYAPPPREERQRALDELLSQHFGEGRAAAVAKEEVPTLAAAVARRSKRGGARRRTWVALGGGTLAMAAAVALVWVVQPPERPGRPEPGLMPGFEPHWGPGYVGPSRSGAELELEPGCDAQVHRDGDLTLALRPELESHEDIDIAAFARSDEREQWLKLTPEIGDEGAITIDQSVAELELTPGRWSITFFIVRQRERPEPAVLIDAAPGSHPGFLAIRTTVCVKG